MSLYDYQLSREIERCEHPFYALLMAAIRRADSTNFEKFKACWPEVVAEVQARYDAPGGKLPGDEPQAALQ
jgi:hypothetical protein